MMIQAQHQSNMDHMVTMSVVLRLIDSLTYKGTSLTRRIPWSNRNERKEVILKNYSSIRAKIDSIKNYLILQGQACANS